MNKIIIIVSLLTGALAYTAGNSNLTATAFMLLSICMLYAAHKIHENEIENAYQRGYDTGRKTKTIVKRIVKKVVKK